MSKSKTDNRGFSLLEALLAIAVILVGILAIVKIFPLAFQVSQAAAKATIATNLAQAKIEEIFYLDYDNITLGALEAKHRLSADPANPFYYYQRQTVAKYVDGNLNYSATDTGLKKITATVYWRSPILKNEKNLEIKILISKK